MVSTEARHDIAVFIDFENISLGLRDRPDKTFHIKKVLERLLEKALSRDQVATGSHVEGTTAREAKDLIRELRDAFKAAGFTDAESKSLIVTVRNRGYRLGIPAKEIVVEG